MSIRRVGDVESAKSAVINAVAQVQAMARVMAQALYENDTAISSTDVRYVCEGMDSLLDHTFDALEGVEDKPAVSK